MVEMKASRKSSDEDIIIPSYNTMSMLWMLLSFFCIWIRWGTKYRLNHGSFCKIFQSFMKAMLKMHGNIRFFKFSFHLCQKDWLYKLTTLKVWQIILVKIIGNLIEVLIRQILWIILVGSLCRNKLPVELSKRLLTF